MFLYLKVVYVKCLTYYCSLLVNYFCSLKFVYRTFINDIYGQ